MDGGNAVDAAIATLFCVGVVNPHSAGIGGGFMMAIYDSKTGTTSCLDALERPAVVTADNGNATSSKETNAAVAVPGQLAGYWAAHQRYGRLPWYRIVLPSAFLADDELIVSRNLAKVLQDNSDFILEEPSMRYEVPSNYSLKFLLILLLIFV